MYIPMAQLLIKPHLFHPHRHQSLCTGTLEHCLSQIYRSQQRGQKTSFSNGVLALPRVVTDVLCCALKEEEVAVGWHPVATNVLYTCAAKRWMNSYQINPTHMDGHYNNELYIHISRELYIIMFPDELYIPCVKCF